MEIPVAFISVKRFNCEKMNDLIKQVATSETTIPALLSKIASLDVHLREKSVK